VKPVTRIIDLLLYTSVFTACCAAGLCMATERLVSTVPPSYFNPLLLLVFGSTLVVYNTPRLIPHPYGRQRRPQKYMAWHIAFLCIGAVLAVAALSQLSWRVRLASAALGVFAFAYYLPLLPFKNKKRLRDIGWLKIAVLAGVWTTATAILPIIYLQKSISDYPFEILLRFVFIFALCVVFDIRDMRADLQNNIHTLPNAVGIRNSYRLIHTAIVLFAVLSIIQYTRYPLQARMAGALLTAVITWAVVYYIRRQPSDRAYLLLADGVMFFYALMMIAV